MLFHTSSQRVSRINSRLLDSCDPDATVFSIRSVFAASAVHSPAARSDAMQENKSAV